MKYEICEIIADDAEKEVKEAFAKKFASWREFLLELMKLDDSDESI